ncbi:MAG: class I SAM-dependent methyltransferase, partial [Pseudomonadota bacterium]
MFSAEASSYRDPSGHVFYDANSVLRSVTEHGRAAYEGFRSNKQVAKLVEAKMLIGFEEIPRAEWPQGFEDDTAYLLRHPKIDFISYPYEWPFAALKRAALFHLDLHMELLKGGLTLSDASAYNVQFR